MGACPFLDLMAFFLSVKHRNLRGGTGKSLNGGLEISEYMGQGQQLQTLYVGARKNEVIRYYEAGAQCKMLSRWFEQEKRFELSVAPRATYRKLIKANGGYDDTYSKLRLN